MRILVIEPDSLFANRVCRLLNQEGYAVDRVDSAAKARTTLAGSPYDLMLFEPGESEPSESEPGDAHPAETAYALIEEVRASELKTPILVLSHHDAIDHKVACLDAGADDFLAKPCDRRELLARCRSLLRRRELPPIERLTRGNLDLDCSGRQARVGDSYLDLTPREFALLEFLMLHRGRVFSRCAIAEHVWEGSYEARSNVIDVIISRLRRKLAQHECSEAIATVRGCGWALREAARVAA